MKQISFCIISMLLFTCGMYAQVSVTADGSPPDNSSMLDVKSTTKGMLVPRMTTAQRTAIASPAEALLVYDISSKTFWYVKNSTWTEIVASNSGWSLSGNSGTNALVNFIGTSDSTAFKIRVNNKLSGWIDPTYGNTGLGYRTLINNSNGTMNTASGYEVLDSNISGSANTAIGYRALYRNTSGGYNTAGGSWSLHQNTTGVFNTAGGFQALMANSSGWGNSSFGTKALYANTLGSANSAFGGWALNGNSTGTYNTAAGYNALYSNTTGSFNTSVGYGAGYYLTGGNENIFLGSFSGPLSYQDVDSSMWLGKTAENEPAIYGDLTDGRIGIGTSAPHASAKLEISSDSQGFLPPRLTTAQIEAIEDPANGLMVFCISDNKFYAYLSAFQGWKEIAFGSGYITTFQCGESMTIDHQAGSSAPVDKTVTYSTVNDIPGEPSKCWITSNLGSSRQATSVDEATEEPAGWYWQFNRPQGYQHDGSTRTPNTAWIITIDENASWYAEYDPCFHELGAEWRIPTYSEWINVQAAGNWTNWNGPWSSALKLHAAGGLMSTDGSLFSRSSEGFYWSSIHFENTTGLRLHFTNSNCSVTDHEKTYAYPLRCLRD